MTVVFERKSLGLRRGRRRKSGFVEAWGHQKDALKLFLRTVGGRGWKGALNCLLVGPPGSGKTLVMQKMSIAWARRGRIVIIVVPERSIKSGFHAKQFTIDDEPVTWAMPMNFTRDFEPMLRDRGEVQSLIDFLQPAKLDPDPDRRYWVCTHATLLAAFQRGADFSRAYVVIDEAHHLAAEGAVMADLLDANEGGKLLQTLLRQEVPHLLCTATPFRTDRRAIFPRWARAQYVLYTRERADHLNDMRYVAGINVRVLSGDVDSILNEEFRTIKQQNRKAIVKLPRVATRFATDYARQLGKHGQVKYDFEKHVIELAKKHGLTIISLATQESDAANGAALDALLSAFREAPNDPERFAALPDIVLVQERLKEGTDCAAWSTVIQIGLSGSPVELIQLQGRATRDHVTKDNLFVEHVCVIPVCEEADDELVFDYTMDTVKSLVVLGFMASEHFEELVRRVTEEGLDPNDVFARIDEAIEAAAQGKVHPEQRKLLNSIQAGLPADLIETEETAREPETTSSRQGSDRASGSVGGGQWRVPDGAAVRPRPIFLSRRFDLDVDAISDEEVISTLHDAFLALGKGIRKSFAKDFHARLVRRSQENRRLQIIALYEKGHSLRQVVVKLSGLVTEAEVQQCLRAAGKLRDGDLYTRSNKRRRKQPPANANRLP